MEGVPEEGTYPGLQWETFMLKKSNVYGKVKECGRQSIPMIKYALKMYKPYIQSV